MQAIMLMTLVYVMWLPVSQGQILYPVVALGALAAAWRVVTGRLTPNGQWLLVLGLVTTTALCGALVGSWQENPGLTQQLIVWLGAPLIWGTWAAAWTEDHIASVIRTITLATAGFSLLIILFVAQSQGVVPAIIPEQILAIQGSAYDFGDSGSAIRWLGLSTLVISGPLCVAAFLLGSHKYLPGRLLTGSAAILSTVAALVAGRRAIVFVLLVAPLLTWLVKRWLEPSSRNIRIHPFVFIFLPLAFVGAALAWNSAMLNRIRGVVLDAASTYAGIGPGSGTEISLDDAARTSQAQYLLDGWLDRPLMGHGLGAVIPGQYRSLDRPWTFELQYHMLAFDLGLLGMALTVAAVSLAARELRRTARVAPSAIPVLTVTTVSAFSLLAANASNPYLQAVGHWWGLAVCAGTAIAVRRSTTREDGRTGLATRDVLLRNTAPRAEHTRSLPVTVSGDHSL